MDPYNILSYESIPFQETHPRHLAALGRLNGINTADPKHCRVLELGCATGGNLISMAFYHPDSHFVGIDLSIKQIEAGHQVIENAGLKNIELHQADIFDLTVELGEFDYIIAHGVYSWVPEHVRNKMLEIVPKLLSSQGLFYVSFNTFPGWRMRGMLRDILLFSCRGIKGVQEKLDATYVALDRLTGAVDGLDALNAQYFREEIKSIKKAPPSYLLFEYLSEENNAFLFSDFLTDIEQHDLRYVCDATLASDYPANLSAEAEHTLQDLSDSTSVQQWLDFATNRNFRRSILCKNTIQPSAEIRLDDFADFYFHSELSPPKNINWRHYKAIPFKQLDGEKVTVEHPLCKALLVEMYARQPSWTSLVDLLPQAQLRLAAAGATQYAEDYEPCLGELFRLFANRSINACPYDAAIFRQIEEAPLVSSLTNAQLDAGQTWVATANHTVLEIDSLAARVLFYLDGKHTLEQISQAVLEEIQQGKLKTPSGFGQSNSPLTENTLKQGLQHSTKSLLYLLARQGLLQSNQG